MKTARMREWQAEATVELARLLGEIERLRAEWAERRQREKDEVELLEEESAAAAERLRVEMGQQRLGSEMRPGPGLGPEREALALSVVALRRECRARRAALAAAGRDHRRLLGRLEGDAVGREKVVVGDAGAQGGLSLVPPGGTP